jgi:hypothetical protein
LFEQTSALSVGTTPAPGDLINRVAEHVSWHEPAPVETHRGVPDRRTALPSGRGRVQGTSTPRGFAMMAEKKWDNSCNPLQRNGYDPSSRDVLRQEMRDHSHLNNNTPLEPSVFLPFPAI